MLHIFLGTNFFVRQDRKLEFFAFRQLFLILGHITNQIKIQLVTWVVINRDLLLLVILQYLI